MQFLFTHTAKDVNTKAFATDIINLRRWQAPLNRAEMVAVGTYF